MKIFPSPFHLSPFLSLPHLFHLTSLTHLSHLSPISLPSLSHLSPISLPSLSHFLFSSPSHLSREKCKIKNKPLLSLFCRSIQNKPYSHTEQKKKMKINYLVLFLPPI